MKTMRGCLALLVAGTVSACSHDSHEKTLNVYNWADYIGKDTLAQFEKETGIRVVYDT